MATVAEVMSPNPPLVKSSDVITKVRALIRNKRLRAVPVVEKDKLVGIISRGDVMRITATKTNITAGGLMQRRVLIAAPGDEIISIGKEMVARSIRQYVVVEQDKVVGMITMRDILRQLYEEGKKPKVAYVDDVMSRKVVVATPQDNITSLWNKMVETCYSGLPVVEKNKLVGVVTRMDVIRKGSIRPKIESGKTRSTPVKKIMTTHVMTSKADREIQEAVKKLVYNTFNRLPVVNDKKQIVGIVDLEDLLRAYVA